MDEIRKYLLNLHQFPKKTAEWLSSNQTWGSKLKLIDILPHNWIEVLSQLMMVGKRLKLTSVRHAVPGVHPDIWCWESLYNSLKSLDIEVLHEAISLILDDFYSSSHLPFEVQKLLKISKKKLILRDPTQAALVVIGDDTKIKLETMMNRFNYIDDFRRIQLQENWVFDLTSFLINLYQSPKEWPSLLKSLLGNPVLPERDSFMGVKDWIDSLSFATLQKALCWKYNVMKLTKQIMQAKEVPLAWKASKATTMLATAQKAAGLSLPNLLEMIKTTKIERRSSVRPIRGRSNENSFSLVMHGLDRTIHEDYPPLNEWITNVITQQQWGIPHTEKNDILRLQRFFDHRRRKTQNNQSPSGKVDVRYPKMGTVHASDEVDVNYPEISTVHVSEPEEHKQPRVKSPCIQMLPHDISSEIITENKYIGIRDIHKALPPSAKKPVPYVRNSEFKQDLPGFDKEKCKKFFSEKEKDWAKRYKLMDSINRLVGGDKKYNSSISDATPMSKALCDGTLGFLTFCQGSSCYIDAILLPVLYHNPLFLSYIINSNRAEDGIVQISSVPPVEYEKLATFPILLFIQEKIQNFLQNAAYYASNGYVFNIQPLRELLAVYSTVIRHKVSNPAREFGLQWGSGQSDPVDLYTILTVMFVDEQNENVGLNPLKQVSYQKDIWSVGKLATAQDAVAIAKRDIPRSTEDLQNDNNIVTITPGDDTVVIQDHIQTKLKFISGDIAKDPTIQLWRLLESTYFMVFINRIVGTTNLGKSLRKTKTPIDAANQIRCENGRVLNLVTVVVHTGNSEGGHYTSYIKCKSEDSWVFYDDTKVNAFEKVLDRDKTVHSSDVKENSVMYLYVAAG